MKREGIMRKREERFFRIAFVLAGILVSVALIVTAYFYRPAREELSTEELVEMFELTADDPMIQFEDEFYTVGNLADYSLADVNLAQIRVDAMAYVAEYYGSTVQGLGLDAVPVIINQKIYIDKTGDEIHIYGGAVYSTDGVTRGIIIHMANLETLGVGQVYPKHAVFWVFVHEYVHCARKVLGVNSRESAIEEGETTLTTALVLENLDIPSRWYMDNLCTDKYRDWADVAATNWGVQAPWWD